MKRRTASAAVLLLVFLVACGGGGGDAGDDPVLDSGPRDDMAIARDANLRISDFPTEWRATPQSSALDAAAEEGDRVRAACEGRPPPSEVRTAAVRSDDFAAQDTRRVSSSVQLVRTEDIAKDDFAALKTDRAMGCLKTQIDAEFRRQNPGLNPDSSIDRFDLPQFADDSLAYRYVVTTVDQGAQVRTYIDFVWMRKGRIELNAGFINRGSPFPTELERTLLQRMVGRA